MEERCVVTDHTNVAVIESKVDPSNPAFDREAKAVLACIQSLPGNGWLIGQQGPDNSVSKEQAYIHDLTGKRPAIRGFDMAEYISDPIDEAIESWQQRGQIVTLS